MCPCQSGCPDGCPCPDYVCPSTSPDILILNTFSSSNLPRLTNSNGKDDSDIDFIMGENTQVERSCSLTWRGEHYVFGGSSKEKQVSKIIGCELKSIGKLFIRSGGQLPFNT